MAQIKDTKQTGNLGMRISRLRKEKGLSQVLVSDYERGRLRPNPETIIKLAQALFVTTDELLGVTKNNLNRNNLTLKTTRRMQKIENLPNSQKKVLFKTIDTFLKGAERTP